MKYIELTRNKITIVDDKDFEWINRYKWCCSKGGYAMRGITIKINNEFIRKTIYLHKQILNAENKETDHINGNSLDNRRKNLRIVTHKQNSLNRKVNDNSNSKLKGVWWYARIKKWQVYIVANNKRNYLGVFKRKLDAAKAYNQAAKEYFGEFARLNKV